MSHMRTDCIYCRLRASGFGSHGHYDLLNFEAAAYGHSLIVDQAGIP